MPKISDNSFSTQDLLKEDEFSDHVPYSKIDEKIIDTIINSINIADVIGSYIKLTRAGSNFKARCPFHEEKTGSFTVSPSKQIFKCFGCGKAGNVITFVRDYEKISFIEAVRKLAERINLEIPTNRPKKKLDKKTKLLYTIYSLANDYYIENLKKHGSMALTYLKNRQLTEETINKFNIGFSLNSYKGLLQHLKRNQINDDILDETGLFKSKNNNTYDIFRERIMFPIHDINSKVVAFGGRALTAETEKFGKYINSPTTRIYQKGNVLYGLYHSRYEINKMKYVIVSEGYLDFLRLWECGFTNSVATLGTALTEEQLQLLKRYTNNIYILFDSDRAGKDAAIKGAALALKTGLSVKIINLPVNEDPDTYLLKNSPESLQLLVNEASTLIDFIYNNKYHDQARESIDFLIEVAHELTDLISRDLFLNEISKRFDVQISSLKQQLSTIRTYDKVEADYSKATPQQISSEPKTTQSKMANKSQKSTIDKHLAEAYLIQYLIKNNNLIKKVASELDSDYFINSDMKSIYIKLCDNHDLGIYERIDDFLNQFESEALKGIITGFMLAKDFDFDIQDLIMQIKLRKLQENLNEINEQITKNPDNAELCEEKIFLRKEIQALSKSVVHKIIF
ncbi:MAG: DNA primase [Candidatus Cloacimonetes bacterium]|nr:DNA primase [Candidatus Cloacimonadota bacterium]